MPERYGGPPTLPCPAYRVFGESDPVLVTRAVFATVDWL
jgi:hypothetical protein